MVHSLHPLSLQFSLKLGPLNTTRHLLVTHNLMGEQRNRPDGQALLHKVQSIGAVWVPCPTWLAKYTNGRCCNKPITTPFRSPLQDLVTGVWYPASIATLNRRRNKSYNGHEASATTFFMTNTPSHSSQSSLAKPSVWNCQVTPHGQLAPASVRLVLAVIKYK